MTESGFTEVDEVGSLRRNEDPKFAHH
jgi:hypothetical protein